MRVPCAHSTCLHCLCIGSSESAGQRRFWPLLQEAYQYRMHDSGHFKKSGKARIEPIFAGLPIDRLVVGCRLPAKPIDRVDNLLDRHLRPMNPIVAVRVGIGRSASISWHNRSLQRSTLRAQCSDSQQRRWGSLSFASRLAQQSA